jgi:hypothetical protein
MLRKLRPRSAYDLMAALALFLVVTGGTAFAVVASNQVNSSSIIDKQVKNQDLAADSVGGGKVIDNSLGRADINESNLRKVPSAATADNAGQLAGLDPTDFLRSGGKAADATHADNATTVGGLTVRKFDYVKKVPTNFAPLFTIGDLTVIAGCQDFGNGNMYLRVEARTAADTGATANPEIYSSSIASSSDNNTRNLNFDEHFTADSGAFKIVDIGSSGDFIDGSGTQGQGVGQTRYRSAGGLIVSIDWAHTSGNADRCHFFGTVTAG